MKMVSVLGSTGSIGLSTLDVVRAHPRQFCVRGLAAGGQWTKMLEQIREFRPRVVALSDREAARKLREALSAKDGCTVLDGPSGVAAVAQADGVECVVAAITGAAGLMPVIAAIGAGKTVLLANKESLVAAGALVTAHAQRQKVTLVPVDSEHSAIAQCLRGEDAATVQKIWLTASGGPFLKTPLEALAQVTPQMALCHPNWSMGAKITVDSATLMNKGLEVIEAHWLFGVAYDRIQVVIHPQSIVHSAVEFADGSIIAQMGLPDMKLPILYALGHPERLGSTVAPRLDLSQLAGLSFERPDTERFRCLLLAFWAGRAGKTYPAVLNAANEVAVGRFLESRLGYAAIPALVEEVLSAHQPLSADSLESVLEADKWARGRAAVVGDRMAGDGAAGRVGTLAAGLARSAEVS